MEEQLLETWAIHDRIHRYLLEAIPAEALPAVAASKGRTVGEQFAHVHNVRLMWLKSAAPEGLEKLEKEQAVEISTLAAALERSGEAIASLLRRSLASDGRIRGFKPHAAAFLGYLVSHESHHRGQIVLTLKQAGFPLERKVAYGLWEWGSR
jgi:uncharacterized damage-inducible protein DinB